MSAERIALQSYWRHKVLALDHRPVLATFAVGFQRVDRNLPLRGPPRRLAGV